MMIIKEVPQAQDVRMRRGVCLRGDGFTMLWRKGRGTMCVCVCCCFAGTFLIEKKTPHGARLG
jgi:hypothetical protein